MSSAYQSVSGPGSGQKDSSSSATLSAICGAHRSGAVVAARRLAMANACCDVLYRLDDGLGMRSMQPAGWRGWQEILEVDAGLASRSLTEQQVRSRATQFSDVETTTCVRVGRIERRGTSLHVVADIPEGVRLADVLTAIERRNDALSDAGAMELAGAVVEKVAALHRLPGALAHGALSPSHVVLTSEGAAVLTDGIFALALESQRCSREQLWRQ